MSDDTGAPSPLKKFSWPFPKTDTSASGETSGSDVTDPRDYYEALALAEDGFYPIGANGQWHGGIHFGRQTADRLDQDNGIRCIADGEVIAWKIDETYPTVEYDTCGSAKYSTGFVLVRHRLALPAAPAGEDASEEEQAADNTEQDDSGEPTLLFYSLYIHLRDWQSYRQTPDDPRPPFWGEGTYAVGDGASDADRNRNPHIPESGIGLNLRNAANAVVGFAPRGTQLRLGERRGTSGYYEVTEVVGGSVVPPGLTGAYAFRDEMTAIPAEPATKGSVVIPESPIGIAAGALVGHLGEYKRYIDAGALCSDDPRPLAQIDVFTTDDIEAFIETSRARAAQLPDSSKTLLVIEKGAQLAVPAGAGETPSAEQLAAARDTGGGPVAGHTRVIPIKALDAVAEEDGTRWWPVDVGTQAGETAIGWVREHDHANVRLASPWEWPGFEIVRVDDTRPDQFYAHRVVQERHATPDEQGALEQRGGPADSGSIFRKLYDTIDDSGDKKITSDEIRRALQKTWLAQALSHLIVEHESEWSGPMDKWNAIDELIPENRKKDWAKEKERIESLLWWDDAKGQNGLPSEEPLIASNMHPVALVANFSQASCCNLTVDTFTRIFGSRRIFHHRNMPRSGTAYDASISDFVDLLNAAFARYGFTECRHKHHFLAQCYHESDHFNTTQEYASGWDYDLSRYPPSVCDSSSPDHTVRKCNRRNQIIAEGNTTVGDGPAYKGRGIIQLTWKGTYQAYQRYSGNQVVDDPESIAANLELAVDTAFWFWAHFKSSHINTMIDRFYDEGEASGLAGDALDNEVVRRVTRVVNGGDRGLAERQTLFIRIRDLME